MPPPAEHLVLLASEQLWPNLHAVEHWRPGLRRVWVYHTADPARSAGPARVLAEFCRARHHLPVTLAAGGDTPDAVARQIRAWVDAGGGAWVVNATGGTKLMFDGAAAVRGRPGVRVVYRELTSRWYDLDRAADGTPTAIPFDVPAAATDGIPVEVLVRTLWAAGELAVGFGPPPAALDVPGVAAALVAADGRWSEAFRAAGVADGDEQAGKLFERYVAAGLLALGVTNLARGVHQRGVGDGVGGNATQEIDLVANYGARLLVFDCKLRTAEEDRSRAEGITSQLRQAAQTARRLGGLGAEVVLLRPNRELNSAERALAADLRVRVIDRTAHGAFFRRLAGFVGVPGVPESLARADAVLADPAAAARAFHTSAATARAARAAAGGPVIELAALSGDWARECGRDWAVARVWPGLYRVQLANRAGRPRGVAEADARAWLGAFGAVTGLRISNSGDTLTALVEVAPGDDDRFRAALACRTSSQLLGPYEG